MKGTQEGREHRGGWRYRDCSGHRKEGNTEEEGDTGDERNGEEGGTWEERDTKEEG